ncbi:uncharacterized protein LOC108604836 isoform X2 [Drosophila busckii]|uniref:uncharacterized protein LOC108604836 isoform X2 n=1 Tax=Drosophila busckii TaxID=30019 RepID=UPI00083F28A3|nr:uncharacterized protein LOC108604836 isoform X2 [Drosophila busckii]
MFGWQRLQHVVPITTICLWLLMLMPTLTEQRLIKGKHKRTRGLLQNEDSSWRREPEMDDISVKRMYDAYWDRQTELKNAVEHHMILDEGNGALIDKEHEESMRERMEFDKEHRTALPAKSQCVPQPARKEECVPKSNTIPCESSMIIITVPSKLLRQPSQPDLIITPSVTPTVTPTIGTDEKDKEDTGNRRLAKLNRIYKEFSKIWQQALPDASSPNVSRVQIPAGKPIQLTALDDLLNVVEHLRQPHAVDNIAEAIKDKMRQEEEIVRSCHCQHQSEEKCYTGMDSNVFKRLAREFKALQPHAKAGGLYQEYMKQLTDIIKGEKSALKANDLNECHCRAVKPANLASDPVAANRFEEFTRCRCDGVCKETSAAIQAQAPCKSQPIEASANSAENMDCSKALQSFMRLNLNPENNLIGGNKPYYLSNSRSRQMIWNEVPLVKSVRTKVATATVAARPIDQEARTSKLKPTVHNPQQTNTIESLCETYQRQLHKLDKLLQSRQHGSQEAVKVAAKRGLTDGTGMPPMPNDAKFPEVLVSQVGLPQQMGGGNMIDSMARQLNILPTDLAQRIAAASGMNSQAQAQSQPIPQTQPIGMAAFNMPAGISPASQTGGTQLPNTAFPQQASPAPATLGPVLEKILHRLQLMQDINFSQYGGDSLDDQGLPCCFPEPTDGAPCELRGSWESLLLGIRIIIHEDPSAKKDDTPTCIQPKTRSQRSSGSLVRRQCIKMSQEKLKEVSGKGQKTRMKLLNITIEETVPPRPHELLENITEWKFQGSTLNSLGGPLTISCQKMDSNLIGSFVGFCRTCGCIDSIFGSWTFCQPSRGCQDITMSIFDRRDVMRRYTLDEKRRNRIKEQLYMKSKYGKNDKAHGSQVNFAKTTAKP